MSEVKLEALLGKTEEQAKQEYVKGLIAGVKKKVILPILKSGVSKETILNVLSECNKNGYNSIISLPGYIAELSKNKLSTACSVGVVIGYPLGENTVENTIKEIGVWSKSAVDEIVVVLSLSDIKFNKCKNTEKILKTLAKVGKKKQVSIMVESGMLNDLEFGDFIKKLSLYKTNKIYTTTGFLQEELDERIITKYKSIKNLFGTKYVALSKIANVEALQQVIAQVDYIVCERATILLEETFSKISI